ncbi:MAG TPA: ABC transporter permease [Rubrobacter sp.]|nr:ABC transporter permease [Rubrobacter sp.]
MTELYRYRDLIKALVARDLKVRYRRSAIGFLWTMLQPLLMMLVLRTVFSSLFQAQSVEVPNNYAVYAMAGILFWNFFSQSIVASMNSLRGNSGLLEKLPVPKAVFPLSTVISGLINLVLALVPLLAILLVALFTLGAGLLLSPLAVFFSDVVELVGVLLTLMMYLTPVFYPKDIVPEHYRWIVRYNPIRSILEVFRDPIYQGEIPPLSHLTVSVVIVLLALGIGGWVFRRSSDRIPFYI